MPKYTVVWAIDLEADDPVTAVREALTAMRDAGDESVFVVYDEGECPIPLDDAQGGEIVCLNDRRENEVSDE